MFIDETKLKEELDFETVILCRDTVDSTSSEARRLIECGAEGTLLVIANAQTAGRGRNGKSFYSPEGTGLYMSLALRLGETSPLGITCAAAVAVCQALEELGETQAKIKWVNDIYLNGKKVCGILCEAVSGTDAVIIGIGINIKTAGFPESAGNAGSLNIDVEKESLICSVLNRLYALIGKEQGEYMDYYRTHSLLLGKEISLTENGVTRFATAIGIESGGGLQVRLENGAVKTLTSGEISVRPR